MCPARHHNVLSKSMLSTVSLSIAYICSMQSGNLHSLEIVQPILRLCNMFVQIPRLRGTYLSVLLLLAVV